MTYHFTVLSPENESFIRRIAIDHEATFLSFNEAIALSVGFEPQEMSSFFTSNNNWEKLEEITLLDMEDADCMIMEDTLLCDVVSKRKEKLIYVFDLLNDRCFFIELSKITTETMVKEYICTFSEGKSPRQVDENALDISLKSIQQSEFETAAQLKLLKNSKNQNELPELEDLEKFESIDDFDNIDELFEGESFMSDDEYY